MDLEARMDALFAALAAQDLDLVRTMVAADARMKRNNDPESDRDELLAGVEAMAAAGLTWSYSDVRRVVGDGAVAEQHVVTIVGSDGTKAVGDVCVVVRFDDDGMATRLDEYVDSTPFAALLT